MFRSKPNALEDASLEALYAEVLGPNDTDDVMVLFDDGTRSFSVEFADFSDRGFRGFNVAGPIPDEADVPTLVEGVDLHPTDIHTDFVVFETDTDDPAEAVGYLEQIADSMGVSMDDIDAARRRTIEMGGVLGRLHRWLNPNI